MGSLPEPLRYGVAGDDGKIDWSRRTEPIAADVRPDGNAEQGWTTGAAYREALQKNRTFKGNRGKSSSLPTAIGTGEVKGGGWIAGSAAKRIDPA